MVASQVSWRQSSRSTKGFAGVTAYGTTDCGRVRKHNEDVVGVYNDAGLYVVCDGMGGHAGGEVASSLALSAIHTNMAQSYHSPSSGIQDPARYSRQSLDSAILRANRVVKDRAAKDTALKGMGTTLAAMHVTDAHVAIGHVGDSRVYRWRKHTGLDQLTRDHSLMNQLIDQGELIQPFCPGARETFTCSARMDSRILSTHDELKRFSAHIAMI
jgi:serine/threonine protein phosphatase PrpC